MKPWKPSNGLAPKAEALRKVFYRSNPTEDQHMLKRRMDGELGLGNFPPLSVTATALTGYVASYAAGNSAASYFARSGSLWPAQVEPLNLTVASRHSTTTASASTGSATVSTGCSADYPAGNSGRIGRGTSVGGTHGCPGWKKSSSVDQAGGGSGPAEHACVGGDGGPSISPQLGSALPGVGSRAVLGGGAGDGIASIRMPPVLPAVPGQGQGQGVRVFPLEEVDIAIPPGFELRPSGTATNVLGIWTKKEIAKGTKLGPFKGVLKVNVDDLSSAWEIVDDKGRVKGWVDASERGSGNWLKLVRGTMDAPRKNLIPVQVGDEVYYKTTRVVAGGEEMLLYREDAVCPESELEAMDHLGGLSRGGSGPVDEGRKQYPCSECDQIFPAKVSLRRHEQYACPARGAFAQLEGAARHEGRAGEEPLHQVAGAAIAAGQCPPALDYDSRESVNNDSGLAEGEVVAHSSQGLTDSKLTYPCTLCDKVFADASNMQRHMRGAHAGARCHTCMECGKTFATSSGLKQHQHIHSSVKPFQCEVCFKAYTQFSNLCRHKRMHADCRQQIKCKECDVSFSTLTSLNKHRRFCDGTHRGVRRYPMPMGGTPKTSQPTTPDPSGDLSAAASMVGGMGAAGPTGAGYLAAGLYPPGAPHFYGPGLMPGFPFPYPGAAVNSASTLAQLAALLTANKGTAGLAAGASPSPGVMPPATFTSTPKLPLRPQSRDSASRSDDLHPTQKADDKQDSPFALGGGPARQQPLFPNLAAMSGSATASSSRADRKRTIDAAMGAGGSATSEEPAKKKVAVGAECPMPLDLTVKRSSSESSSTADGLDQRNLSCATTPEGEVALAASVGKGIKSEGSSASTPAAPVSGHPSTLFGADFMKPAAGKVVKSEGSSASTPAAPVSSHPSTLFGAEFMKPATTSAGAFAGHLMDPADRQKFFAAMMASYPFPNPAAAAAAFMDPLQIAAAFAASTGGRNPMGEAVTPVRTAGTSVNGAAGSVMGERFQFSPATVLAGGMATPASVAGSSLMAGSTGGSKSKDKYACKFCGKVFPRSANLTRHLRTHTGEQPYKCQYCDRSFSISSNLQRHVRNIHNKEKPFKCPRCDRCFGQQTNLDRHLLKHEGDNSDSLSTGGGVGGGVLAGLTEGSPATGQASASGLLSSTASSSGLPTLVMAGQHARPYADDEEDDEEDELEIDEDVDDDVGLPTQVSAFRPIRTARIYDMASAKKDGESEESNPSTESELEMAINNDGEEAKK